MTVENKRVCDVIVCTQGVIRGDRDLEALGAEFREAYSKRPDDSALNDSRLASN